PDRYSILSLGASTLSQPPQTFYREFQPDSKLFQKEALGISGLSMENLAHTGTPPNQALIEFSDWVGKVTPADKTPIFTAFNAPFDWMFVNTYFHKYLGYNPFGHKALDIKALFMGFHKVPFLNTSHHQICAHYGIQTLLTHHALEDAVQEAELLKKLISEIFNSKERK
ncbi:MAG: 3'-5' exonuclease, partial [Gammaproteobacteria bacterium]|nr:3'-5' exonuclease [Gammaproteobacteria bacterium]